MFYMRPIEINLNWKLLRNSFTAFLFNIYDSFKSTPKPGTDGLDVVHGHLVPLLLDSSLQRVDTL